MTLLDNPVWHALVGPHATWALGRGAARHYPRAMAPFSAIAEPSDAAYADLAVDLPPNTEARLFRAGDGPLPRGWRAISTRPILQMLIDRTAALGRTASGDGEVIVLGASDRDDMLELADVAKPGPFGSQSRLMGRYIGVRQAGTLVAMAGERMRLPGFVELSGICTHPAYRGHGLASVLTMQLALQARQRGEVPFLHVFPDNPATALYERLGFRTRAQLFVLWRRPTHE